MKLLILSLLLLAPLMRASAADCPNVRLSVIRQEKCQQCAMLISGTPLTDGERVVLRLVNSTAKPVVVYGFKFEDDFNPTGYLLEQSKDTCRWKYPNGDETTFAWNERSPESKREYLLAVGRSLEIEATFNKLELGSRYKRTVFVASGNGKEPCEIASEEIILLGDKPLASAESPAPCQPNCKLSLAQVPVLHGLKLGMSVEEVLALYPDFNVEPVDKFNVRPASLYVKSDPAAKALLPDVFGVYLHFLKEKLVHLEISYWASGQSQDEFQLEKTAILGLAGIWALGNEAFECETFEIQAIKSPLPRIVMTDKAARNILAKRIEESYRKPEKEK